MKRDRHIAIIRTDVAVRKPRDYEATTTQLKQQI